MLDNCSLRDEMAGNFAHAFRHGHIESAGFFLEGESGFGHRSDLSQVSLNLFVELLDPLRSRGGFRDRYQGRGRRG